MIKTSLIAKMALENDIRKRWDEIASWWAGHVQQDPNRAEVIFPHIFRCLGELSGKRVLDAGCGEGILARALRERGAEVVGVDFARVLEFAKQEEQTRPLGITFTEANISRLDMFTDNSFDAIVCNLVLQGWPDIASPLNEFRRLLVKAGLLLITVHHPSYVTPGSPWFHSWDRIEIPDYSYAMEDVYLVRIEATAPAVHYFHRSLEEYCSELRKAGFSFREHILAAADTRTPEGILDTRLFFLIEADPR